MKEYYKKLNDKRAAAARDRIREADLSGSSTIGGPACCENTMSRSKRGWVCLECGRITKI